MDLGESTGIKECDNLPELSNTMFMVVSCWVWNSKINLLFPEYLQALYADVRRLKEPVDLIEKNGGQKELHIVPSMFMSTWEWVGLDEVYIQLYCNWITMNDPIHAQISYNCFVSNTFKLEVGYNLMIFLVEMGIATGRVIEERLIGPTKVISASHVNASSTQLRTIRYRVWKVVERLEDWSERR